MSNFIAKDYNSWAIFSHFRVAFSELCCLLYYMIFLSLVAGKPKKQGALISICIMLGPDFISDTIVVETSDHARLKVAISMNNVFRVCVISQLNRVCVLVL